MSPPDNVIITDKTRIVNIFLQKSIDIYLIESYNTLIERIWEVIIMAKKKHILPQVDSSKVEELLTVQKKLESLPRDKLMYIAGAVAAMSADVPTTTSKT